MKHSLFLTVASAALAVAAPTDPVCIVGAGPTGLTIANRLEALGRSTVIFEKDTEVGGKCNAYYENGLFHPMGAVLFSNETYRETLPVIKASGVLSMNFTYNFKSWLYNPTSGVVRRAPLSPDQFFPKIKSDVDRYSIFWNQTFSKMTAIGYKEKIPVEYTVPTAQWLAINKYESLKILFVAGMVPYGYGDVDEVPIIYMLQYFTPDILRFFAGQHEGYIIDFHKVFVQYAKRSVKGPFRLGTEITGIVRSEDGPSITYRSVGASSTTTTTQPCSKLVLAFPPVLRALEAAKLNLSSEEKTVFSPVRTTKYWSGAVRVATPDGDVFTADPLQALGRPVAFIRIFNESDIATTWSWGKSNSNQTRDQAKSLLQETLSKFNKDPRNTTEKPRIIGDDDIKDFKEWDYFPHYDQAELANGYYDKFNKLQGKMNTYYASGFNGFETVEFAIRAGKDIVNTYFSNL